jgi:hypothetical protein
MCNSRISSHEPKEWIGVGTPEDSRLQLALMHIVQAGLPERCVDQRSLSKVLQQHPWKSPEVVVRELGIWPRCANCDAITAEGQRES